MAWLVGGGIVLYYIVPCRPNVVNTAERTVTRNCITFATISFLFISAVCVVFMVYGLIIIFPGARLVTAWFFPFPMAARSPSAFPLCQAGYSLVSAITI